MIVYKDLFNGDEVMSEVYKYKLDYDNVIMKVQESTEFKSCLQTKNKIVFKFYWLFSISLIKEH